MPLEALLVQQMLQGSDIRDAQSILVETGMKKNQVKAAALRLKKLFEQEDEA